MHLVISRLAALCLLIIGCDQHTALLDDPVDVPAFPIEIMAVEATTYGGCACGAGSVDALATVRADVISDRPLEVRVLGADVYPKNSPSDRTQLRESSSIRLIDPTMARRPWWGFRYPEDRWPYTNPDTGRSSQPEGWTDAEWGMTVELRFTDPETGEAIDRTVHTPPFFVDPGEVE